MKLQVALSDTGSTPVRSTKNTQAFARSPTYFGQPNDLLSVSNGPVTDFDGDCERRWTSRGSVPALMGTKSYNCQVKLCRPEQRTSVDDLRNGSEFWDCCERLITFCSSRIWGVPSEQRVVVIQPTPQ